MKDSTYLPKKKILTYILPTIAKVELSRYLSPMIRAIKPGIAVVKLTERCCLRCVMCNEWRQGPKEELTHEEWKNVLKQLKEVGFFYVGFTGGEPLMRKDLPELISYATKLGLVVGMVTNGYLLDESKAEALVKSGVTRVSLSIDALGEKYDYIRGVKGAFERVKNAAEILSAKKDENGIDVNIGITLMRINLNEVLGIVNFAERLNISVNFSVLDYTPYFLDVEDNRQSFWIQENEQRDLDILVDELVRIKRKKRWLISCSYSVLEYIRSYFRQPVRKDIPCAGAIVQTFIDAEGKVYGGCWSEEPLDSLKEKELHEILYSEKYAKACVRRFKKDCINCACTYRINLQFSARHLLKDVWRRCL